MNLPDIHCKAELLADLETIADETCTLQQMINKWALEYYSTSKHLLVLNSIATGLDAEVIVEVGFGRSTFALLEAANGLEADLICCDRYDYSGYVEILPSIKRCGFQFVLGDAKTLIRNPPCDMKRGVDFMFFDYFSSRERSAESTYKAIHRFLPYMRQNGIIAVHDTIEKKYFVKDAFKRLREDKNLEVMSLPYNYGLGLIRKLDKSEYGKIEDNWKKKGDS